MKPEEVRDLLRIIRSLVVHFAAGGLIGLTLSLIGGVATDGSIAAFVAGGFLALARRIERWRVQTLKAMEDA